MTGTLDPVRSLTGLTKLVLHQNSIGGMFVRTAVGIAAVDVVMLGIKTLQTCDFA